MERFILGDELGNIKVLRHDSDNEPTLNTIATSSDQCPSSIQQLAIDAKTEAGSCMFASALSDGRIRLARLNDADVLELLAEVEAPKVLHKKYIGLAVSNSSIFSCSTDGLLQKTVFNLEDSVTFKTCHQATLPSRLAGWRLSADDTHFCYGGDEVEASIWNTERAFQTTAEPVHSSSQSSKKRKRNDNLFPAETWRARNLPNDHLGLRQPVRITSLAFMSPTPSIHNIVAGTQFGDVRRYDTRTSRRPVSNWKAIGRAGSIAVSENGRSENELFVADSGSSLFALDLRNGRIIYGYSGIAGAVTSISQSTKCLASTAMDRYARIHSTVSPPPDSTSNQEYRGSVLHRKYTTTVPTVVEWDRCTHQKIAREDDEVWDTMEHVG